MKLVAQASVLANAVTLAATAMRRKPLARVVTADDAVSVTCSDNHIAISANAAATVLEPGAVALSADRLAAVTSGFPASAMVTMSTAEGAAAVVCGNSRSRLAIVPWTDLPSVLAIESEIGRVEKRDLFHTARHVMRQIVLVCRRVPRDPRPHRRASAPGDR